MGDPSSAGGTWAVVDCRHCSGSGRIGVKLDTDHWMQDRCADCDGRGEILRLIGTDTTPVLDQIRAWCRETFPQASIHGTFRHIEREIAELEVALVSGSRREIGMECADLVHLLVQLDALYGRSLETDVTDKLAINRKRQWKAPDGDGVVEHVRDSA